MGDGYDGRFQAMHVRFEIGCHHIGRLLCVKDPNIEDRTLDIER
jgi:hypothetical protein